MSSNDHLRTENTLRKDEGKKKKLVHIRNSITSPTVAPLWIFCHSFILRASPSFRHAVKKTLKRQELLSAI